MRIEQMRRRLCHGLLGSIPATYLTVNLPGLGTAWEIGAALGTAGLWVATFVQFPVKKVIAYRLIALLLIIGFCTMVLWTLLFGYLTVANVLADHTTADLASILGKLEYAGDTLFLVWLLVGPIAVAIHFITRARNTSEYSQVRI
jgi:hypothetical protein